MPFHVIQATLSGVVEVSWHEEKRKAWAQMKRLAREADTLWIAVEQRAGNASNTIFYWAKGMDKLSKMGQTQGNTLVREIIQGRVKIERRGF